ncbi:putative translation initiation factor, beta propellor-like domain, WD40-repeat-containing [Plasmopara halstedii]
MQPSRVSNKCRSPCESIDLTPEQKRNKWTRLILRELYDLGFCEAAAALEQEASVQLRSCGMKKLQHLVATCQWDEALQLVTQSGTLHMKSTRATREAALLLLQRKFIEYLLNDQLAEARRTFQDEILSTYHLNETEVKELAELLLCRDAKEMHERARKPWHDDELIVQFEALVSPEEMIPKGALRKLVHDEELHVPLSNLRGNVTGYCFDTLTCHTDDVWALAFSPDGQILASASKNGYVVLYEISSHTNLLTVTGESINVKRDTTHIIESVEGPIDCLAWSSNSRVLLLSGTHSTTIQVWNRTTKKCEKSLNHPIGNVSRLQWLPNGDYFVSGSTDKLLVLWNATDNSVVYQWSGRRVVDVVVHPRNSNVFVLLPGFELRVYDVTQKSDHLILQTKHVVSCLVISSCGHFLLLNCIKEEQVMCVESTTGRTLATFQGMREQRYILRPCFIGFQHELVASGSEDGKVFVWERESGKLAITLDGHSSVVNEVVCHPIHTNVIATASDDKTIRLWSLESME